MNMKISKYHVREEQYRTGSVNKQLGVKSLSGSKEAW